MILITCIALLNASFTLLMAGVIWFVQIVHYPLFERVGELGFSLYEEEHKKLTTIVVAPLMLMELFSSIVLVCLSTSFLVKTLAVIGLTLVILLWLSTAFIQVPLHNKLSSSYSSSLVNGLVQSNWIRTVIWSVRSIVVILTISLISLGY